jgi:long-subunit fatty acid transport protein
MKIQKNKGVFLFFLFLLLTQWNLLLAQNAPDDEKKKGFDWNRFFIGGNIGNFQFGIITSFEISPTLGYKITDKFSAGIGLTYSYYNDRRYRMSTDIYGYRVFLSHVIYNTIFAYTEYEALSLESDFFDVAGLHQGQERFWLNSFFIGLGYKMEINDRAYGYIMLLYNLKETTDSPYSNPVIRVGINL